MSEERNGPSGLLVLVVAGIGTFFLLGLFGVAWIFAFRATAIHVVPPNAQFVQVQKTNSETKKPHLFCHPAEASLTMTSR